MADMTTQNGRLTGFLPLGSRTEEGDQIEIREPTEEQVFVLAQLPRMLERKERVASALDLFGDVIEQLMCKDEDRDWALRELVAGRIGMGEFSDLAVQVLKYFNIDAPVEEPTPIRRARPVAKKAARRR